MKRILASLLIVSLFFAGCNHEKAPETIKIAITKLTDQGHYSNYGRFILAADSTVELIDLYHTSTDSALELLKQCHGLVICGGPDIYPAWYSREQDTALCGTFDRRRDTLEYKAMKRAIEKKIPILGICRGEQMINVALGGSLYADIPSQFTNPENHRCSNPDTCYHPVYLEENSLLCNITEAKIGVVNTNHHQGVRKLAPTLRATGHSHDGFTEVVQWADTTGKNWLLGVQWHPERLNYEKNPFSLKIGKAFMEAVKENQNID